MKKLILATLFLAGTVTAQAQTDAKAKVVLDNLTAKVKTMKSLKTNFSLSLASANGKTKDTKKGTLEMKGEKYHVALGPQEIFCDGKTVWTYLKDASEVQVSTYNPGEQTISPAKLFTNFYDKEYAYVYAGQKKVGGKTCDMVTLTPKAGKQQFKKVELAVDAKTNTLVGGTMTDKSGTVYHYEVSGYTPNAPVSESSFSFDSKKYKNVEVVDLR